MATEVQEGPHRDPLTTSIHNGQDEGTLGGVQSLPKEPNPTDNLGVQSLPKEPDPTNNLGVQSLPKEPDPNDGVGWESTMATELQERPHRDPQATSHHNGQAEDIMEGVQSLPKETDPTNKLGEVQSLPTKLDPTSELQEGPHRDPLATSHHNGQHEDNLRGVKSMPKNPDPTESTGADGSKQKAKRTPQKKKSTVTTMASVLQEGSNLTTSHHNGQDENNLGVQSLQKEPDPTDNLGVQSLPKEPEPTNNLGVQSLPKEPDPTELTGADGSQKSTKKPTKNTKASELQEGPHPEHLATSIHNGQTEDTLGGVQSLPIEPDPTNNLGVEPLLKEPDPTDSTGVDGNKKVKRIPKKKKSTMATELHEGPHLTTSHHNGQNEDTLGGVQSLPKEPEPTNNLGGVQSLPKEPDPTNNLGLQSLPKEPDPTNNLGVQLPPREPDPTNNLGGVQSLPKEPEPTNNLGVQSPPKEPNPTESTGLDGSKQKAKRTPQKKKTTIATMAPELQETPPLTTSYHNGQDENNLGGVQSLPKEPDPTDAAGWVIREECDKINNSHSLNNGECQGEKLDCNGDSRGVERSRGLCSVCEIESHLNCSGCGAVYYCGEEHQREHWQQHKQNCPPYKLVSSSAHGRNYVSTRRLSAGQVIFEESAVVDGPQPVSELLCLGCHKLITLIDSEIPRCPKCLWPLCSIECIRAPRHQHECPILATDTKLIGTPKGEGETPRYDIIMALRCLLLKDLDPETWKDVLSMPHKSDERLFDQELHEVATVQYLLDVLHIDYPPELVNQMKGIISRNALQIRSEHNTIVRGLYPRISLFKHSCTPNVQLSNIDDGVMKVRTTCTVELGEPLCISYTDTMLPLWERQAILSKSYNINCDCKRCLDPTEIGTYFSSPRCPECKTSFLEPFRWLDKTSWVCPVCKTEESDAKVREGVVEWMERLQMDDLIGGGSIKSATAILEQVEVEFHPTHYFWMRVAQTVLQKLRHNNTYKALRIKRKLWQRLRTLYTTLEPGLTKRQGMALLETGAAMLLEAKAEYEEGQAYIPMLVKSLPPIVTILQEARKVLEMEPPGSQMRVLAERAEAKRKEAQEFIETLSPAESRSQ